MCFRRGTNLTQSTDSGEVSSHTDPQRCILQDSSWYSVQLEAGLYCGWDDPYKFEMYKMYNATRAITVVTRSRGHAGSSVQVPLG